MTIAPAPQLAACLQVLHLAAVYGRLLGYEGSERGLPPDRCEQLADLMDAVHNIPGLIAGWENCDESLLRGMLRDYDARWSSDLLHAYDHEVTERS